MMTKKIECGYIEPEDYIPEEIRRKLKIGEFAEETEKDDED